MFYYISLIIYIHSGNLILVNCIITCLYFQKGGFMYKDIQYNRTNLCTNIINNDDIESLRKSFIETLNHDLKTPIIAQIRALELMLKGNFGMLNTEQSEMTQLTLDSCRYMYSMVATLISTYRFDSEEFVINYSYFNFMQVLESCVKKLSKYAKESNIKIVIIPKINNPMVAGDQIRLTKVILTFLSNAIYTAFKNSIMKIYLSENEGKFIFKLESRSGYITDDKMQNLFKIYTDPSQKFNRVGEGIGFYLVKKIIEKHNGKIIAESSVTQKNIFGFEIPIEIPATEELYMDNCV